MKTGDFTWKEVGSRIKTLRLTKGLKQDDLASAANLTNAAISFLEAGKTSPKLSTLQQLALALDCSVRYLLCGDDPQQRCEYDVAIRRIIEILASRDADAIRALWSGITTSEVMIRRRAIATCDPHQLSAHAEETSL